MRYIILILALAACATVDPIAAAFPPCGGADQCVIQDGARTITIHDGMNPPVTRASGRVLGYAAWTPTTCEVWLAPGTGSGTWRHELEHCRVGHFHS